jgi:hypothetical protein
LYWATGGGVKKRWKNAWESQTSALFILYIVKDEYSSTSHQHVSKSMLRDIIYPRVREVGMDLRHQWLGDSHVDPVRFLKPRALCCLTAIET